MTERDERRNEAIAQLSELRQAIRPVDLEPGTGGGLTLMLAAVGSHVWTTIRLVSVDAEAMTVRMPGTSDVGAEVVVHCSGRGIGECGFRMRVESVTPDEPGGTTLRLVPLALSSMHDD